jgi:hypothetical protein
MNSSAKPLPSQVRKADYTLRKQSSQDFKQSI